MKPEIFQQIEEIAKYYATRGEEEAVLTYKLTRLVYQVEYDVKIEAIDKHIQSISSSCNDKLS